MNDDVFKAMFSNKDNYSSESLDCIQIKYIEKLTIKRTSTSLSLNKVKKKQSVTECIRLLY